MHAQEVAQEVLAPQEHASPRNRSIEENSHHEMEYPPAFRLQDKHPVNMISGT